jgi:hypothetical protein
MHRPSRWGYVQFSTKEPGEQAYQPDPDGPVRERLMTINEAERTYHSQKKTWAKSLEELGLAKLLPLSDTEPLIIRLTKDGYEVEITRKAIPYHPQKTWVIRQDSRLTAKPTAN